jgi:hypothetical protein
MGSVGGLREGPFIEAPDRGSIDDVTSALPGGVDASSRHAFIEATAAALGKRWAAGCCCDLHREGRPASGGWPGTLREARALVGRTLPAEMQSRSMNTITEVERELAVRTAYASARGEWRRHAAGEAP